MAQSTVQNVIDQAFAKSAAARPDAAIAPQQFINQIGLALRAWFNIVARENPYLLGQIATVAFDGTGWPYPLDCLKWIAVNATASTIASPALAVGADIAVTPFDDQLFAAGSPSCTEFGQKFLPAGQAIDPSGGALQVLYTRAPVMPTQLTDVLDALFPEFLLDYLNYDLAAFMAANDQRKDDEATFLGMKAQMLEATIEWATGVSFGVTARFPLVTPPLTNRAGGVERGRSG